MPGVCLIYAKDMPYAGKMRIFIEYNRLYQDRPLALADYLHYYNNKRPQPYPGDENSERNEYIRYHCLSPSVLM